MSSIKLITSSNSVRNTTISCGSLGVHYDVWKPNDAVIVRRVDDRTRQGVLVGEFSLHKFSKDVIRFGPNPGVQWMPVKEFLVSPGSLFKSDYVFVGNDGVRYRWHLGRRNLKLCRDAKGDDEPLIIYNRHRYRGPSYLEIRDSSVMNSLDYIILTFLIAERKRRDKNRRRNAAVAGGASSGGGS